MSKLMSKYIFTILCSIFFIFSNDCTEMTSNFISVIEYLSLSMSFCSFFLPINYFLMYYLINISLDFQEYIRLVVFVSAQLYPIISSCNRTLIDCIYECLGLQGQVKILLFSNANYPHTFFLKKCQGPVHWLSPPVFPHYVIPYSFTKTDQSIQFRSD